MQEDPAHFYLLGVESLRFRVKGWFYDMGWGCEFRVQGSGSNGLGFLVTGNEVSEVRCNIGA